MKVLRHTNNWSMDKILLHLPSHLTGYKKNEIEDYIAKSFHLLARQHGSSALWLTDTGILFTRDKDEAKRDYPYEDWLQAAIQTSMAEYSITTSIQDDTYNEQNLEHPLSISQHNGQPW